MLLLYTFSLEPHLKMFICRSRSPRRCSWSRTCTCHRSRHRTPRFPRRRSSPRSQASSKRKSPRASCSFSLQATRITMSSTCGNCDCADKTNCPKKGNSYGVVIEEKTFIEEIVEFGAENDGKCKCSSNCTCAGCGCGK